MVEIPLTQGYVALVDDADAPRVLAAGSWWSHKGVHRRYARGSVGGKATLMHRLVLDAPQGVGVDHINGNGLDNRRENLRFCDHSLNAANMRKRAPHSSRFKGVSWHSKAGKWEAYIKREGRKTYLGCYVTEAEAARVYDAAAREYFGEFARPNFPA